LSLLGVGLLIEETHEFFVLGLLNVFGLDGQRFAALLEKLENVGIVSDQSLQPAIDEVSVKDRVSLSIRQ